MEQYTDYPVKTPGRLESAAVGGIVADAHDIYDIEHRKRQSEINKEIEEVPGEIERIDEALSDRYTKSESYNKTEINNKESGLQNQIDTLNVEVNGDGGIDERLQTVEQLGTISVGGGNIGIATASDFENPTPEQRAKVPTVGAILDNTDDEPTAGSNNLIKSGGVFSIFTNNISIANWNDNKMLRDNGGVIDIPSSHYTYNSVSTTDQIDCSQFQSEKIYFSYGITGATVRFIFYTATAGIASTYAEYTGTGNVELTVPAEAVSFRVCVISPSTDTLLAAKQSIICAYDKLVSKDTIVDNLNTRKSDRPLSANMGAVINDMLGTVIEEVNFELVWEDNRLMIDNGGVNDVESGGHYNACATTQIVDCSAFRGKDITLKYGKVITYFAFYTQTDGLIGTRLNYTGIGVTTLTVPVNAYSFRVCVDGADPLADSKNSVSVTCLVNKQPSIGTIKQKLYSQQLFGAIDYAMPTDFDYAQLMFIGQSFAQGGSSKIGTTGIIPNCYMFGDNLKAISGNAFNPLQQEGVEYPVVSCVNSLSKMYRRYGHNVNIVASTVGSGGIPIKTLLTYAGNAQSMQSAMKTVADSENKTVGCFGIVFMQGESDYYDDEDASPNKAVYKNYLMQVKNAFQQSAMQNLGQEKKPIFFIYQTSGFNWIVNHGTLDNEQLGVSMAQIEFAEENDDVILISPAYQVTTYHDGHPATNGERWLGEIYAKAIWQTLYRGWRYSNPVAKEFEKQDDKIIIYVSSCVLPLQINTWTLPEQLAEGFVVKADGTQVGISSVEVDNNAIIINLATSIASATTVSISYGGVGVGRGNICDSDEWSTWLKYLSDAEDTGYDGQRVIRQSPVDKNGNSIVGKNYPMNNFLSIFYKEL